MRDNISKRTYRINEAIRAKEVRLIDEEGKQIGILPLEEALEEARARDLDLVEVAPNANPPVCRIMDYGKYLYLRAKRERKARKGKKGKEVKEIRLRPKTGEHDVAFKIRYARRFLTDGCKVKVYVSFRGREITYPELGLRLLEKVATELEDVASVEQQPRMVGRGLLMLLKPK